ncbi:MAG TPA: acyltransferase [Gemmatimonadaceae bacterium]|jgi:maltose O-acetyltransferase
MSDRSFLSRVRRSVQRETELYRPKLETVAFMGRLIPRHTGSALRSSVLRRYGFKIGKGTLIYDVPRIGGALRDLAKQLTVGEECVIELGVELDLGETITIGNRVTIGPEVLILTTSHELGPREQRAGPLVRSPVVIEDGAWIGARATVLPGVTIGAGAIVGPGSVVNKDVAPNTRVAGNIARQIEVLST